MTKKAPAKKAVKKAAASFAEKAANSFMTMEIGLGKKTMTQVLPKAVRNLAIAEMARGKHRTETDENQAVDLIAKLFGPHHEDFKKMVLAPRAALRTLAYEITLALSQGEGQKRGPRLVAVTRVPEVISKLAALKKAADDAFEAFMPDYDRFCDAGKRAIDHKMPFSVNGRPVSALLKYPSAEDFRAAFYIRIGAPKPLATLDMSRYASMPADLAAEIADANAAELTAVLESAKAQAIEGAKKLVDRVAQQLGKGGERLFPSLITEAQATAQVLKDMCEGYDFDVSLMTAADSIQASIGDVTSTKVWKDDPIARRNSLRAAQQASKVLGKAAKVAAKKSQPVKPAAKNKSGAAKSNVVMGGMLADLIG